MYRVNLRIAISKLGFQLTSFVLRIFARTRGILLFCLILIIIILITYLIVPFLRGHTHYQQYTRVFQLNVSVKYPYQQPSFLSTFWYILYFFAKLYIFDYCCTPLTPLTSSLEVLLELFMTRVQASRDHEVKYKNIYIFIIMHILPLDYFNL